MDPITDPFTNPAFIAFSALVPLIVALVKQQGFASHINALLALVVYFTVGILAVIFSGMDLTFDNIVPAIATMTVVGTAAYNLFWSRLGPEGASLEERLTDVTSIVKAEPVE